MADLGVHIGVPATQYGTNDAIDQGSQLHWDFFGGERQRLRVQGPGDKVYDLYRNIKAVAGNNPSYDSCDLDAGEGIAVLLVDRVEDGEKVYELLAVEERPAVESARYFQTDEEDDGALTGAEILEVFDVFENRGAKSTGWRTKQENLYIMLCRGETEYLFTRWVLRETQIVSKRSTVEAVHDTVDEVETPPSTRAVNSLLGGITESYGGEWLRRGTIVRQIGGKRWEMSTEWWWALKWSRVLYGGTLEP